MTKESGSFVRPGGKRGAYSNPVGREWTVNGTNPATSLNHLHLTYSLDHGLVGADPFEDA